MTDNPSDDAMRELSWRKKLTPIEERQFQAWLAAHPEHQTDWQAEAGLNEALDRLRDAPVASNFTARAMAAVQHENAQQERKTTRGLRIWQWQVRWLPRLAGVAVVMVAALFSYHRIQVKTEQRVERAHILVAVSELAPANPEFLENFDAIRAMDQSSAPDEELLALLQ